MSKQEKKREKQKGCEKGVRMGVGSHLRKYPGRLRLSRFIPMPRRSDPTLATPIRASRRFNCRSANRPVDGRCCESEFTKAEASRHRMPTTNAATSAARTFVDISLLKSRLLSLCRNSLQKGKVSCDGTYGWSKQQTCFVEELALGKSSVVAGGRIVTWLVAGWLGMAQSSSGSHFLLKEGDGIFVCDAGAPRRQSIR